MWLAGDSSSWREDSPIVKRGGKRDVSGGVCRGAFAAAKTNREASLFLGKKRAALCVMEEEKAYEFDAGTEGCTHGGTQHGVGESEGGQDHRVEGVCEIGLGKGCKCRVLPCLGVMER